MRRLSCDHNLRFISKMDSTCKSPSSFSSYKSQYDGGERRMRETLLHCLAGHSARNWLPAETPTGIAQFANHYKRVSARSLVCAFNFSELSKPGRNRARESGGSSSRSSPQNRGRRYAYRYTRRPDTPTVYSNTTTTEAYEN